MKAKDIMPWCASKDKLYAGTPLSDSFDPGDVLFFTQTFFGV